jgi:hypothetical protein
MHQEQGAGLEGCRRSRVQDTGEQDTGEQDKEESRIKRRAG